MINKIKILNRFKIYKSWLFSALLFLVIWLVSFKLITHPIYPNQAARTLSEAIILLLLVSPIFSLILMNFYREKLPIAASIAVGQIHWLLFFTIILVQLIN